MGSPPLPSLSAPHQCLWAPLERCCANTEAFSLIYCRVTWMCIPSLPSYCSCHFWHLLHSVLSSLGAPKLLFLSLGVTVLPYSSAKLSTRVESFPQAQKALSKDRAIPSHPAQQGGLHSSSRVPELQASLSMRRITEASTPKSSRC